MASPPASLPMGPSLDFLLGRLAKGASPCSAFTHDKSIADKAQCVSDRPPLAPASRRSERRAGVIAAAAPTNTVKSVSAKLNGPRYTSAPL
jgi:hypothetical protein